MVAEARGGKEGWVAVQGGYPAVIASHSRSENGVASLAYGGAAIQSEPDADAAFFLRASRGWIASLRSQ
ncbi:hypothetical protein [Bradyrhizobium sp. LHD-71]|uniref:hypothetical protein n=1 Tax=Bradyrhizobium sp. LHD-71 TaxID=3072141 RepID=UPI00280F636E|nr:hypothetical protein [Bradyrhizobium sp. LHD-71]MDQ8730674.1 hypothetical protein [Bradyrhizobium sp. LHD-71]